MMDDESDCDITAKLRAEYEKGLDSAGKHEEISRVAKELGISTTRVKVS